MTAERKLLFVAALLGGLMTASAQSYYDDDIYYDASKAPKTEKKSATDNRQSRAMRPGTTYQVIPGSDSYTVVTSNTRDVDEYNRRGSYAASQTEASDTVSDDFKYTKKIERFYNPDVVLASGDDDLIYYYNNSKDSQPTQVNIYVDSPDYWNPYYYSSAWSWAWSRPAYMNPWYYNNPWYWDSWSWGWGPSWSWGAGWGPSWSWGWGPSWSWNWGWGPGPSWGWHGHGPIYHRPDRPAGSGATRPVRNPHGVGARDGGRYAGGVGSFRDRQRGVGTYRPGGASSVSTGGRPSTNRPIGSGRRPSSNVNSAPYNPSDVSRPTGTYAPSNNSGRRTSGVNSYRNGNSYRNSNAGSQGSYRSNQNSQGSYRNSNSNTGSYRSSGGGRSGGGGFSGGGRSGGGASGRH